MFGIKRKLRIQGCLCLEKERYASEKLFRADKSYLGNGALRVASEEAANNKIFIGFIALIIRCRIYTALKDKAGTMVKKPNYLTVLEAIRELEKIEMCRLMAEGKIQPEKLITHRFTLEDMEKGLQIMRDKTGEYVKVMVGF